MSLPTRVTINGSASKDAKALVEGHANALAAKAYVEVIVQTDPRSPVRVRCVRCVGAGPAAQIAAHNMAHHLRAGNAVTVKGHALHLSKRRGVALELRGDDIEIINHSLQAG
jgi:hypothetical protein